MIEIRDIEIEGYERVVEAKDKSCGLHAFIAIHSTLLGPSLGGTRIHPYATEQEALNDVLRLSKAMTYKSAVVKDGLGGGKSVIIANPKEKTPALLHAFAQVLNALQGTYIAAEDMGSSAEDMAIIHEKSPYVAARKSKGSSGDPSRFTAWGVFRGIQAISKTLWGNHRALRGKRIAIQGLGNVGSKLAEILFWRGANLIICDINEELVEKHRLLYEAEVISSDDFTSVRCDILAPCAMGAIINETTIKNLHCRAIAGAANNQLCHNDLGAQLQHMGILYAPDYVINAGGIINAAGEFDQEGYHPRRTRDKTDEIYEVLLEIFARSRIENKPTSLIADQIAEYNLSHKIGQRTHKIF